MCWLKWKRSSTELREAIAKPAEEGAQERREELGDVLFSIVNVARFLQDRSGRGASADEPKIHAKIFIYRRTTTFKRAYLLNKLGYQRWKLLAGSKKSYKT